MGFRAAQVICLLAVSFNLVMAGRDTSPFATTATAIRWANKAKLNLGHHMKQLHSQMDQLKQKTAVSAGEQVEARKLQQEDCFSGSCPANQFCNMNFARRRLQQQADGFCERCYNPNPADPMSCFNQGLGPAGEYECESSCSSTPPSYDSSGPALASSTSLRWRCCNSTVVAEEFFVEGCAGEPFVSFTVPTDQMPDCSDNFQRVCPAGGTGDMVLRYYGSGTDCTADEFIDISYAQCTVNTDSDDESDSDSDDTPPPECVKDCPGFAELEAGVDESVFAMCTTLRKWPATTCLDDCNATEAVIVDETMTYCAPVNETEHTVNETECSIPIYSTGPIDWDQQPAASCPSQQTNEHWQPEWDSDESASRGTFEVTSGCGCRSDGDCIYSTNYPEKHGSFSSCQVMVHSDTALSVVAFYSEACCDHLEINGNFPPYSGCGDGLNGTVVSAGDSLSWDSDSSVESGGFKICAVGSMSDSSSDTNATIPSWATRPECEEHVDYNDYEDSDYVAVGNDCNTSTSNTHWTPEWDQISNEATTNATKGTFEVTSGCGCWTDGDCIYSMNYPGIHGSDTECEVTVHSDTALSVVAFNTEACCDTLEINGNSALGSLTFSGCGDGLDGTVVSAGDSLYWDADGTEETGGFKVCAAASMSDSTSDTDATTPSWAQCNNPGEFTPPTGNNCNISTINTHWTPEWDQATNEASTNAMKGIFEVTSGCGCWTDGDCIYSTNFPGAYDSDTQCRVMVHSDEALSVVAFETETCCDYLEINGNSSSRYSGCGRGLNGTVVSAGDSLSWDADSSINSRGFKICAVGSMSDSSSDTSAATPFGAACCDSAAVNTHWTPEWDEPFIGESNSALKGAMEVLTTDGCGCWTDGDCVYSNNFGDGDYNVDDHCTVDLHQSLTLAVMAFQAPAVNLTESRGWGVETFFDVGESGHYMTVQMGYFDSPSYHSGDGSSLDGLVLPEGSRLEWTYGGHPLNITGKGFAICAAATPDWSAMRDWSPPSDKSSSTPEAPNPETMPAEVFVAVTTAFSELSMEAMLNMTFRSGFLSLFKNSTAAAAGVPTSYVTVHEMRAGSVIVDASVQIPDSSQRATFHSLLSKSETATIYSALAQDYGESEVIAVKLLTVAPTAQTPTDAPTYAGVDSSDKSGGTTTVPLPCTLAILVSAALLGLCSSGLW